MITSETYIKNTINLVKSFTIKSNDTAIQINNELIKIYGTSILGYASDDKTKWKYYMNICGIYHPIDNPIKITIIETGLVKDLSKELLLEYPTTHQELLKHDVYYTDLIDNYPNDELLIKGIIYGLDMDYVLNAEDGSILSYSEYYVEEQESNLISEVNTYSINYLKRWHIREYGIVDNLFIPALLGTLYSKLVLKILNIRFSNIQTSNVHSFHIYEFFRSHFDVDTSVLNKSTRFWLYKNMRYIRKNIGSNETLNIIIDKILTNNGIGIAEIELINSLPDIELLDLNDVTKPLYDKKINSFISKPRNDYYFNSDSDNLTGYQMLYLQFNRNLVDNDLVIKNTEDINNKHLPKLDYNILHRQKTKTFKIKINKNHVVTQDISIKLLLDNWTFLALNDKFRAMKKFIDPNTGIIYNLTPKQALFMVYKLLAKINGLDNPIIKGYTANHIINDSISYTELTTNLLRNDVMETISRKIQSKIPTLHTYIGNDTFNNYIKDVITFRSLMWNISTNTNDMLLSSDIQVMYKRLHKRVYIDFGLDKDIDTLISEENMYFTLTNDYDYKSVLKELFYLFTGFKIIDNDIENTIDKYINITKKLSSYTIQFISDKNDLNIIPLRFHTLDSINAGVVDIRDSTFKALEEFYGFLDSKAILFSNFIDFDTELIDVDNKTKPLINIVMYDNMKKDLNRIEVINNNIVASTEASINMFKPDIDSSANKMYGITTYENNILRGEKLNNSLTISLSNDTNIDNTSINVDMSSGIDLYKPKVNNYNIVNDNITKNETSTYLTFNRDYNNIISLFTNDSNITDTNLIADISNMNIKLFKPETLLNSFNLGNDYYFNEDGLITVVESLDNVTTLNSETTNQIVVDSIDIKAVIE